MEKKKKSLFELLLAPLLVLVAGMAIQSWFFPEKDGDTIVVTNTPSNIGSLETKKAQVDPKPQHDVSPKKKTTPPFPVKKAADTSLLIISREREALPPVVNFSVAVDEYIENAKIFVDNEWVANAPNTIPLAHGSHHIRLETENGFYEQMIQIPASTLMVARNKNFKQKK